MNRKQLWSVSAVLLVAVLFSACSPAATPTPAGPKEIVFGCAISLTGAKAVEGEAEQNGIDFWVDWVNDRGGIDVGGENYDVRVIYYDDESDAQTAAKLTEKLITEDGTKFILGPYSSALTIATSAISEKYGAVTVAPLANSGQIYSQGYKNVFAVLPPAANYLRLLIEMAVTELDPKPKTVAVLALDDPFGLACANGTRDWAEEAGLDVVLFEKYPSDAKDLSSLLTKVKGLNPDLVLASSLYEHAALITRQAKELDLCPKLLGFTVGPTFPDFIESLGPTADYVFASEWWLPSMEWEGPIIGKASDYGKMIEDRFGYKPSYHTAAGTAGGVLFQLAIEKAGTLEVDKVRDALASLDVEIFWGPHAFDEKGQNRKGGSAPIQILNGELMAVYPEKLRQAPAVYPFPCWDDR